MDPVGRCLSEVVDIFVSWPMPAIWLAAVAVALWRWQRLSRAIGLVAAVLLVLSSLPGTARLLVVPLRSGAVAPAALAAVDAAAIVVPTAGVFRDPEGKWWPNRGTVRRLVVVRGLQARLGLPLIVSGGAPGDVAVAEAVVGAGAVGLSAATTRLETTARNSAETARAVAAMLPETPVPRVILVTSPTHIARMQGALRRHGLHVVSVSIDDPAFAEFARSPAPVWRAFVPARSGLVATGSALREYVAIAWYAANGWVRPADLLRPGTPGDGANGP